MSLDETGGAAAHTCRSHSIERRPESSSEEVHSNSSLLREAPAERVAHE